MTLAADVNANTPYFVAFKRNVGLVRNSSALTLLALRQAQRIDACYHDPFGPRLALGGDTLVSEPLTPPLLAGADSC